MSLRIALFLGSLDRPYTRFRGSNAGERPRGSGGLDLPKWGCGFLALLAMNAWVGDVWAQHAEPPDVEAVVTPPVVPLHEPGEPELINLASCGCIAGATVPPVIPPESDGLNWAAIPVAIYTPETDFLLGAAGIYFFHTDEDPETRSSYVRGNAVISTKGQWIVDVTADLWFPGNGFNLSHSVQYRDWPDTFFGIGNDTLEENEEPYRLHRLEIVNEIQRRINPSIYVGAIQRFEYTEVVDLASDGMLATNTVEGSPGGILSGVGLTATFDSRDSTAYTMSGGYYRAELLTFADFTFTEFEYTQFTLDARHFFTLFGEHVLALQLVGAISAGDQPFNRLPSIGGSERMRGYYEGRYRDNHNLVFQAEYRLPLFWRFKLAFFGGLGQVFHRVQDFRFDEFKWSAGAGLRFLASEKHRAHLRVDFGIGQDTTGIYFTILEAF